MNVFEVTNPPLVRQFLEVPDKLHRDDPNRTIQLGADIEHAFDPAKNSLLKNGDARRWILYNDWNMPSGRIAAFYNSDMEEKVGGIGFFECNNDEEAAKLLLDTAKNWLKKEGCTRAEGPINFGEKDRFWGLLVSGFDSPVVYLDNYNPPYYQALFENASFVEKDRILTYTISLEDLPVGLTERATQRLLERDQITFRPFDFSNRQVSDLHQVYVECFDEQKRMKHLTTNDIHNLINLNKQVLEEKAFWMAYKGEDPIGASLYMKDLNQSLRAMTRQEKLERVNLKSITLAVIPPFRERGVEMGLLYHLFRALQKENNPYQITFCGINANSRKITSLMEKIGCTVEKIHKTFTINL